MADTGENPRGGVTRLPKNNAKPRRTRATIDLSLGLEGKLDEMASKRGETRTDILRRALEFYVKCEEYRQKDFEVGAFTMDADGPKTPYILDLS